MSHHHPIAPEAKKHMASRQLAVQRTLGCAVAAILLLAPAPGQAQAGGPAAGRTPKVLLIGIDGVRADVLREVPTPRIDALIADGAYTDSAQTGLPTISGPSWTSMLTGVWKEKHGVVSNDFPFPDQRLEQYPDFLTRVEREAPQLRTFAVADWPPLIEPQSRDGQPAVPPVLSERIDNRLALNGGRLGWAAADERSVDAAAEEIRDRNPDALFVYLGNPDEVSHHTGSIGDEYRATIARADRHVGRLVDAIRARPTYAAEDWLILISTDHGRRPDGGHGGESLEERTIFILASGDAALRGRIPGRPQIVDVAATALRHLGVGPRPEWGLDGQPVGLRTP